MILAGLKGGIFEMLQIKMFYHPVLHPWKNVAFFFVVFWGSRCVIHFSLRCLGGEYLLLARPAEATPVLYCTIHPWLSNRSASLCCATRHVASWWLWMLCSWRVGSNLFVWRFFRVFLVVMLGDLFCGEKEGVHTQHPREHSLTNRT